MIIIQDWVAAIPAEEKHIAYVGEGMAETRTFFVTGTDWERYKEWSFHLDLAFDLSSVTAVDRRQVEQTRQAAEEASEQVLAAYGHAGDAASKARAAVIGKYRTGVASHKVAVRTDLYEIRATKMPCLYDELIFHDNAEDCGWFHSGGMEQMAEETVRALCELLEVTYTAPKTESPTIPQPPRAGDAVVLRKEKLYRSSVGSAAVIRTGTFYLYDGKKVNGRYRVTNQKARVAQQPLALYVSGWVEL